MQTKQKIERLLASEGVKPNKRLGQNFLIDLNLMRLLIDEAHISVNDVVLEVGCGTGSFTEGLVKVAGRVICVEYDDVLAKIATRQLAKAENVNIINSDVLETKNSISKEVVQAVRNAQDELGGRVMLVANLPYSIASPVMMNLIIGREDALIADSMCVTVQKEVADRMAASPGSSDYGIISILMEATGQVRVLRKLKPSVFWPRPQVDSSMVRFTRQKKKVERIHNLEFFKETVNLFMGHRRKMLQACVKFAEGELAGVHGWHDIFSRAFVEPHHRPEELSVEEYISICNICYEQLR